MSSDAALRGLAASGSAGPDAPGTAGPDAPGRRRLVELDRAESLALLASAPYGRVVFTQQALPAIRLVNHVVDGGRIFIRTRLTAKIGQAARAPQASVVAYEADEFDPRERTGWSVVATGFARPVTDEAQIARVTDALVPWVDLPMDTIVVIEPELITGFRLTLVD